MKYAIFNENKIILLFWKMIILEGNCEKE